MSKITLVWIVSICAPLALPQQQPTATQPVAVSATAAVRRDSVHRVDTGQMYHRVYARVPIVGTGTKGDPKRPMFAPVTPQTPPLGTAAAAAVHTGILGYTMLISDNGQWALCEFVGATPKDLQVITSAASASVVVFERGTSSIAEIEADFQQYLKGFTFASFAPFTTRVQ